MRLFVLSLGCPKHDKFVIRRDNKTIPEQAFKAVEIAQVPVTNHQELTALLQGFSWPPANSKKSQSQSELNILMKLSLKKQLVLRIDH